MMDADKSYPIEQEYVAPIAPPILPPHQAQEMENQTCKLKTLFFHFLYLRNILLAANLSRSIGLFACWLSSAILKMSFF